MLKMLKNALVPAVLLAFVISGCGPKAIKEESLLDTPDNHYNMGMRELKAGALDQAVTEFTRATALNPNYPGGYVGMALVLSERGSFEKALEAVDKGISKDAKFIDGFIAKGRILARQKKGEDWLENAAKQFDKALKLNPNSEKALFFKGEAFKEAYKFADAASLFSQVISLKGDFSKDANSEWELIQKIQRAAPGTKIGNKIALMSEIDRADLAVLFVEEMKLLEILQKKQPKVYDTKFRPPADPTEMEAAKKEALPDATDLASHWARNWIADVIKAGAMDVFPDRTFRPDDKITRANYAGFIQNILLVVTGDNSLATKYIGSPERFPDVNPSNWAYNAICLCVDRGIMKADPIDGSFGPAKTVSGADALLIIREFQNALRMTF
jgi:tetratricopeptide (TPR) repeat protein